MDLLVVTVRCGRMNIEWENMSSLHTQTKTAIYVNRGHFTLTLTDYVHLATRLLVRL